MCGAARFAAYDCEESRGLLHVIDVLGTLQRYDAETDAYCGAAELMACDACQGDTH